MEDNEPRGATENRGERGRAGRREGEKRERNDVAVHIRLKANLDRHKTGGGQAE